MSELGALVPALKKEGEEGVRIRQLIKVDMGYIFLELENNPVMAMTCFQEVVSAPATPGVHKLALLAMAKAQIQTRDAKLVVDAASTMADFAVSDDASASMKVQAWIYHAEALMLLGYREKAYAGVRAAQRILASEELFSDLLRQFHGDEESARSRQKNLTEEVGKIHDASRPTRH